MTPKFKTLSEYSDIELAAWTLCGYTGNGTARKNFLGSRYTAVQNIINQILADGNIPVVKKADTSVLEKAIKTSFTDAAEDLIKEIQDNI